MCIVCNLEMQRAVFISLIQDRLKPESEFRHQTAILLRISVYLVPITLSD